MNYGFYIKELWVTGSQVETAKIKFEKGFNVVAGESDTGKSYVFSCIEFMLGKDEDPKYLPEASGYTSIFMEIRSYENDEPVCLYRRFGESNFNFKRCFINEFQTSSKELSHISARHNSKNEANISRLLLDLCGLDSKQLKINKNNEKQSLSFSDIRKLICIHEQKIITEDSPFYPSGQYQFQTKDQSLLNLLFTGNDASSLKTTEKKEVTKAKFNSKLELLKDQLERKLEKIREIDDEGLIIDVRTTRVDFESLNMDLLESNQAVEALGNKRNELYKKLEYLKYKHVQKTELLDRFQILSKHYKSDLQRLIFVEEGSEMLSQLTNQVCPVCYQEITEEHEHKITEDDNIYKSILAETQKIKKKSADLEDTIKELKLSTSNLKNELNKVASEYDGINEKLSKELNPKIEFIKSRLIHIVRSEKMKERHRILKDEVFEIEQRITEIEAELSTKKDDNHGTVVSSVYLQKLAYFIEKRLSAWNYEKNISVKFDNNYKVFDIMIGRKPRKSYGKGKRGVSYAASIIGLLDYCSKKNTGFTNTLILDSPLTAYDSIKGISSTDDELEPGIVNGFYRNLSQLESNKQIIVLDNKIPNSTIQDTINYIEFVGDSGKKGRRGFFPINKKISK